ncbi:MAG: hypothetical protein HY718_14170 [Planctomycetes bacterium]|nr:hypothetical protein [Planctomycetota bacterium]
MQTERLVTAALVLPVMILLAATPAARAVDSRVVYAAFAKPPAEYAVAPLWVWNDMLTEEQVRDTLRDMAAQKVMQVFVHPRPGLMTPYLSDEWFKLWRATLDEGRKLGMRVWIYDENSYPSGFAGGFVPDEMPESRGRGLSIREVDQVPQPDGDLIAVYQPDGDAFKNVTQQVKTGTDLPKGKYLVATVVHAKPTPWNAGKTYVDLLYPGVTQKFLDVTLEPYRRHFGDEFGKRIPGSFTDEPELQPAGGLPWTPDLPQVFEKRWGYSLLDHLPCLVRDTGEFKKVRHDYLHVLNELFAERWGKVYHDYCEKNHLQFTGHYWEHEWPRCLVVPDNMTMYSWHQLPAIDNLMNRYSEDLHAQFGNTRTVRELASVANQMGRPRTLCEAYGAGGWDLRFEDMKRIGDWLYVLGVNTLDPHLSYITIRGARKRDHPQSFSYHTPWWEGYHISAEYFARLSAALSQGRQVNDVLLIEPTTTTWMYNSQAGGPQLNQIGTTFEALIRTWEQNQIEYDIGSEYLIAEHGSVDEKDKALIVGKCNYHLVVLPPLTETLDSKTVDLLEQFLKAEGSVICCGEPPALVDARPSDRVSALAKHQGWLRVTEKEAMPLVRGRQWATGFAVRPTLNAEGQLFHHRRVLEDGDLIFLVNTKFDKPALGTIGGTRIGGVEKWNLDTGKIEPYPARTAGKKVEIDFDLPPCGSLLLFLANQKTDLTPEAKVRATRLAADTPLDIRRLDPNVLVLDYADVTCGGETKKAAYTIKAAHWVFSKHGLPRNPWDRAVQFKDELIRKTFPADSGFEATYRFTIEQNVPTTLLAVVERPDLYTITCNGKPVTAAAGQWWLDKAFGRIDIAAAAKVGENTLTIKASPMTMFHELEAAYIIGDFALRPAESGFVIVPEQPLKLGPWNDQGYRLYGHRFSYKQKFTVADRKDRYQVELTDWVGSVAQVVVNGKSAGYVGWRPWSCDVTDQIVAGANEVEVIVFGTLRNTLGPSHKPDLGTAWPGMWDDAPETGLPPGKNYSSVGYGLFEPFVLKNVSQ